MRPAAGARAVVFDQAENRLHTPVSLRSALRDAATALLEGTAGTIVRR